MLGSHFGPSRREKGARRATCPRVLVFLQVSSTTRTKSPLILKTTRKLTAPRLVWSKTYLPDSYSPRFNSLTHNFMDPPLSHWLGDIVAHLLALILTPAFNSVREISMKIWSIPTSTSSTQILVKSSRCEVISIELPQRTIRHLNHARSKYTEQEFAMARSCVLGR